MRARISYIVDDVENVSARSYDGGARIEIDHLVSAKHVRTVVPNGRPVPADTTDGVHISWVEDLPVKAPFDFPIERGLHVDARPGTNWSALVTWLAECGIDVDPAQVVSAANWESFVSSTKPSFDCLKNTGVETSAPNLRLSFGYSDRIPGTSPEDLIVEAWYPVTERTETVTKIGNKTEVGILAVDAAADPADMTVYGWVRNLDVDHAGTRLLFHHVPVIRPINASAHGWFVTPYGLHPQYALQVNLPEAEEPPYGCSLFAKLDLPQSLFADQYQLEDLPRMEPPSELLGVWGETDLEAPVWQVSQGSIVLLRLDGEVNDTYHIPLHFRYEGPTEEGIVQHEMPAPLVYWACQADLPLEHVPGLGFESIYPEDTAFYVAESQATSYRIPAITPWSVDFSVNVTSIAVLVGALAILFSILRRVFVPSGPPKLKKD